MKKQQVCLTFFRVQFLVRISTVVQWNYLCAVFYVVRVMVKHFVGYHSIYRKKRATAKTKKQNQSFSQHSSFLSFFLVYCTHSIILIDLFDKVRKDK